MLPFLRLRSAPQGLRSGFAMGEEGSIHSKPLSAVVEAFEELARIIESGPKDLRLAQFSDACSLVSVLFGCLGMAFKFAELEYVAKVWFHMHSTCLMFCRCEKLDMGLLLMLLFYTMFNRTVFGMLLPFIGV